MSTLQDALARLDAAVSAAERRLAQDSGAAAGQMSADDDAVAARIAALEEERERLFGRIADLEEQAAEDARLRAEAAEAVKAALGDLRAVAQANEERRHG